MNIRVSTISDIEVRLLREYDNGHSINLKIGIDVRVTLAKMSRLNPDDFFWGIELKPEKAELAAMRLDRIHSQNCIVSTGEAKSLLSRLTMKHIVDRVHIYFPTPDNGIIYMRERGLPVRERLLNSSFMRVLENIVRPGGELRVLTDVEEYNVDFEELIDLDIWWVQEWSGYPCGQKHIEYVGTPREKRTREHKKPVFANIFRKLV